MAVADVFIAYVLLVFTIVAVNPAVLFRLVIRRLDRRGAVRAYHLMLVFLAVTLVLPPFLLWSVATVAGRAMGAVSVVLGVQLFLALMDLPSWNALTGRVGR